MRYLRESILLLALAGRSSIMAGPPPGASPCNGVDRHLTPARRSSLSPAVAKQLHVLRADVTQSFTSGGWTILDVNTYQTDNTFLFFSGNPLTSRYVSSLSGSAVKTEEKEIRERAVKSAPGIPPQLAGCFAWHAIHYRAH